MIACETRPLLQGARLTAWELEKLGIPFALVVDGAAAVAAAPRRGRRGRRRLRPRGGQRRRRQQGRHLRPRAGARGGAPFVVAGPTSTIDRDADGDAIEIEERGADEVPPRRRDVRRRHAVSNPAFDVTPASALTALVSRREARRPHGGRAPRARGRPKPAGAQRRSGCRVARRADGAAGLPLAVPLDRVEQRLLVVAGRPAQLALGLGRAVGPAQRQRADLLDGDRRPAGQRPRAPRASASAAAQRQLDRGRLDAAEPAEVGEEPVVGEVAPAEDVALADRPALVGQQVPARDVLRRRRRTARRRRRRGSRAAGTAAPARSRSGRCRRARARARG